MEVDIIIPRGNRIISEARLLVVRKGLMFAWERIVERMEAKIDSMVVF